MLDGTLRLQRLHDFAQHLIAMHVPPVAPLSSEAQEAIDALDKSLLKVGQRERHCY